MIADPVKNFAICTVSTGYTNASTSIVLSSGEGAKLPAPATDGAFNLVWWNSTDYNNPADDPNREIVRVTARSTDTLTVTRGQEGISATSKNTAGKTYKMGRFLTKLDYDNLNLLNVKIANFTRDISTSSGTQVITGVGFQPKTVEFAASVAVTANASSIGWDDGTNKGCQYFDGTGRTIGVASSIYILTSAGNYAYGYISALGADGFTITWTKTGSPTGTATILYRAIR